MAQEKVDRFRARQLMRQPLEIAEILFNRQIQALEYGAGHDHQRNAADLPYAVSQVCLFKVEGAVLLHLANNAETDVYVRQQSAVERNQPLRADGDTNGPAHGLQDRRLEAIWLVLRIRTEAQDPDFAALLR